jgi:hypothetical protein
MTLIHHFSARSALQHQASRRRSWRELLGLGAAIVVIGLVATPVLTAAPPPTDAEVLAAYIDDKSQTLQVSAQTTPVGVLRDSFSASPGIATLAAGGTNHDWAKMVLLMAGWPMTESNVTVFTRWMRQENGPDDWWNRNNPLNNGWGSGGGGGLGSYDTLITAAQNAAEALNQNAGYSEIAAAFASSAPTEVIEAAIWASPWASGHYANGGHWSYVPVPVVAAPADAWG